MREGNKVEASLGSQQQSLTKATEVAARNPNPHNDDELTNC